MQNQKKVSEKKTKINWKTMSKRKPETKVFRSKKRLKQ